MPPTAERLLIKLSDSRVSKTKTNTMKAKLKTTLTCLGLALLAALTFSGCQSTGSSGGSNTHEMGGPGKPRMDNRLMPHRAN